MRREGAPVGVVQGKVAGRVPSEPNPHPAETPSVGSPRLPSSALRRPAMLMEHQPARERYRTVCRGYHGTRRCKSGPGSGQRARVARERKRYRTPFIRGGGERPRMPEGTRRGPGLRVAGGLQPMVGDATAAGGTAGAARVAEPAPTDGRDGRAAPQARTPPCRRGGFAGRCGADAQLAAQAGKAVAADVVVNGPEVEPERDADLPVGLPRGDEPADIRLPHSVVDLGWHPRPY